MLVDADGVAYRDFRRSLTPRYWRVWFDITMGYTGVAAVLVSLSVWDPGLPWAALAVGPAALAIGFGLAFINNFFHEAAHHNLHPDRDRNDLLTNLVMGWLFGSSIQQYRKVHFQHHRALGTTEDSENSYFDPLRIRYLVAGITGIKVVRTLRRYRDVERSQAERGTAGATGSRLLWSALAAVVSLVLALGLWFAGFEAAGVSWLAGLLLAFPFFVSLRQLLEHRSEAADPDVDYTRVDHGAVNRIFGDGPLASTLGSAGFNRHSLHHWEPNLSYTRLGDLETWLLATEVAPLVERQQTTYAHTFRRLLEL